LASELLQLNVDVIASNSTEAILAIRDLNNTIPIVMTAVSDPIGNRLVASFARPGGNITGVTLFSTELAGKRLELLKEVVPQLARVGLLVERDHPPTATFVTETQAAAKPLNLALQIFEVRPEEIPEGFRSIEKEHPDALIVQQTASFTSHVREIADLAINLHLPTVSQLREFIEVGGLLAYGPSVYALGERAAWYVDRILKGTRPAGRAPGRATDQVRTDCQPQDCQSAWPHHSRDHACARRPTDRIAAPFAAMHESAFGTKQTSQPC
jgi:putative ABC transport system substrate-binding protein